MRRLCGVAHVQAALPTHLRAYRIEVGSPQLAAAAEHTRRVPTGPSVQCVAADTSPTQRPLGRRESDRRPAFRAIRTADLPQRREVLSPFRDYERCAHILHPAGYAHVGRAHAICVIADAEAPTRSQLLTLWRAVHRLHRTTLRARCEACTFVTTVEDRPGGRGRSTRARPTKRRGERSPYPRDR